MMEITPITLTGRVVRLEPLSLAHVPDLAEAGKDPAIWKHMLYGELTDEPAMRAWVKMMLDWQSKGADLPFAVVHLGSGKAVGATRYLNIERHNRGLEIGGTWYGAAYQRTAVNTESKYLLLRHAFEDLGCIRVQFKTDLRNVRSQKAIERLGAVKEGVLRSHMVRRDGSARDSVYYSIIESEWPAVKARLEAMLTSPTPGPSPASG